MLWRHCEKSQNSIWKILLPTQKDYWCCDWFSVKLWHDNSTSILSNNIWYLQTTKSLFSRWQQEDNFEDLAWYSLFNVVNYPWEMMYYAIFPVLSSFPIVSTQKFNLIPRNLLSGIEQSRINYFSALNTLIYLPLPELWTLPGGLKVLHRPQLCWKCTSPVG